MTPIRIAALFSILAAVLLVASVVIASDTPEGDAQDQEWIDFIEDNDSMLLIRAYLLVAASVSLVVCYSFGVRPKMGEADPLDRALAGLGAGATLLGAGSLVFGGLIGAAVGAAHLFGDVPVDPGLARTFDNLFYGGLVVGAAVPLGVLMVVVAIQSRRRGAFPQWVFWLSLVSALGMAAALLFLPIVLLPLWLIGMGVALFRADAGGGTAAFAR